MEFYNDLFKRPFCSYLTLKVALLNGCMKLFIFAKHKNRVRYEQYGQMTTCSLTTPKFGKLKGAIVCGTVKHYCYPNFRSVQSVGMSSTKPIFVIFVDLDG